MRSTMGSASLSVGASMVRLCERPAATWMVRLAIVMPGPTRRREMRRTKPIMRTVELQLQLQSQLQLQLRERSE